VDAGRDLPCSWIAMPFLGKGPDRLGKGREILKGFRTVVWWKFADGVVRCVSESIWICIFCGGF
jgi:hypothetical protein